MRKEERSFVGFALPTVVIYVAISYLLIKYTIGWLFDFRGNVFLGIIQGILILPIFGWLILVGALVIWLAIELLKILDAYLLAPEDIHMLRKGECPLCREKDGIVSKSRSVDTILGHLGKLTKFYVFCEHCQQEIAIDDNFCPKCLSFAQPYECQLEHKQNKNPSDNLNPLVKAYGKECTFCGHIEITKKVFA